MLSYLRHLEIKIFLTRSIFQLISYHTFYSFSFHCFFCEKIAIVILCVCEASFLYCIRKAEIASVNQPHFRATCDNIDETGSRYKFVAVACNAPLATYNLYRPTHDSLSAQSMAVQLGNPLSVSPQSRQRRLPLLSCDWVCHSPIAIELRNAFDWLTVGIKPSAFKCRSVLSPTEPGRGDCRQYVRRPYTVAPDYLALYRTVGARSRVGGVAPAKSGFVRRDHRKQKRIRRIAPDSDQRRLAGEAEIPVVSSRECQHPGWTDFGCCEFAHCRSLQIAS